MKKDTPEREEKPELVVALLGLLAAHVGLYRQERVQRRVVSLVIGEMLAYGRRTVTQGLMALGLGGADWSAWYRLFSRGRFDEAGSGAVLLLESLKHVAADALYVIGTDAVRVERSSQRMPGTSWMPALRTAVFRSGLARMQRFVHGAWLPELKEGFSRAVPLRFLPAFPQKAVAARDAKGAVKPCREWEAGLQFAAWVREQLDKAGRTQQWILWLADGSYDALGVWRQLPERCILAVRTARNRALFALPDNAQKSAQKSEQKSGQVGRPRRYGEQALSPAMWLRLRKGWTRTCVKVRGGERCMRYRVEGPFVRDELPERVLFLIVVGGSTKQVGKRHPKQRSVQPCFYLVNAVPKAGAGPGEWELPLPIETLLTWLWQRWELEVAHREMKSEMGVGEIQCWNARSAVLSVQWSVWCYALLVFAGYRTWGICSPPATTTSATTPALTVPRWRRPPKRWSISILLRTLRSALWLDPQFRTACSPSLDNWAEIDTWIAVSANAALSSSRL